MPILDQKLDKFDTDGAGYGFSGTRLENLGASEYTLVSLAVDTSSSVGGFQTEIERCVGHIVDACRSAPRADNLMLRVTRFDSTLKEVHGFKPLRECAPDAYQNALPCGGCTSLYDAVYNAVESVRRYGTDLHRHGLLANSIIFVITDGCDNTSKVGAASVRKTLDDLKRTEQVESVTTVLVAVGVEQQSVSAQLKSFANQVGFDGFIDLGAADPSVLAGLANFVSQHISMQSRMLGTGRSATVSLTF